MKGALEVERFSLRELCEGNLEWDFITGDPERYVKKAQETNISFYRGFAGEPVRVLIYDGL
jgi:hypothetical protein